MAHYRKIDTRIWNDEKFRGLTDDGKLVFFFLLTHPAMTSIGMMRGTIPGLGAELGWTAKAFGEAFREALAKGMARHDEKACVIWLPKFIRYNTPENPNVLKAWGAAVDLLPECDLTREAIQAVKAFAEGLTKAFREALPQVFRAPLAKQEQEQEQEQEEKAPVSVGEKSKKLKDTPVAEDFAISDRVLKWAAQRGLAGVIELHFEAFVSTCKAKGYTYVDWDEAFMNAVRKNWAKIDRPRIDASGKKRLAI